MGLVKEGRGDVCKSEEELVEERGGVGGGEEMLAGRGGVSVGEKGLARLIGLVRGERSGDMEEGFARWRRGCRVEGMVDNG